MKVAVIGCGPAGMMAAYQASCRGLDVTIYDPNEKPGRKLRITGKGRCNVCNNCDVKTVLTNVTSDNSKFLYSALNKFGPQDVISFFEANGLQLKTERGFRVFPQSDNANDVANLMWKLCQNNGVVLKRQKVKSVSDIEADAYIICTGGLSYPLTGSTGDGYRFASEIGHNIIKPRASLVPLVSDDDYCAELTGFSPKNVVLRVYEDERLIYSEMGEMLFTHFGVSGPLVLSASAHINNASNCRLEIDFKPALDEQKLDTRLLRDFSENLNKKFGNYLPTLVGKSMAGVVLLLSGINPDLKINEITHEMRMNLIRIIKAFPVNITGTRPVDEAIVTKGGVDTKEINPRTMQSKLDSRFYFAGEVLNLDAYTGGFNLQIAWSTGYIAGTEVLDV